MASSSGSSNFSKPPPCLFFFASKWNAEASTSGNSIINCLPLPKLPAAGVTSPDDHWSAVFPAKLDENPNPSNPSPPPVVGENSALETPSRILVRLRANNNNVNNIDNKKSDNDVVATDRKQKSVESDNGGDCNNKRPRRDIKKTAYYGGSDLAVTLQEEEPSPRRSRTSRELLLLPDAAAAAGQSAQKKDQKKIMMKKKKKLQGVPIALTRTEIKEDILAMKKGMGRRQVVIHVKKRSPQVQKELDNRFPGLLLPYTNFSKYANRFCQT